MSVVTIPQILEAKLAELTPAIDTQYENTDYTPVQGTPYQQVNFLFTKPSNDYVHQAYNQTGFMQVTLYYPNMVGPKDARTRGELIKSKFKSGSIFSGVKITSTPEIGAARNEGDRFVIPVFVTFSQFIQEA